MIITSNYARACFCGDANSTVELRIALWVPPIHPSVHGWRSFSNPCFREENLPDLGQQLRVEGDKYCPVWIELRKEHQSFRGRLLDVDTRTRSIGIIPPENDDRDMLGFNLWPSWSVAANSEYWPLWQGEFKEIASAEARQFEGVYPRWAPSSANIQLLPGEERPLIDGTVFHLPEQKG